jgi:iron complex outermembrane recepter protein
MKLFISLTLSLLLYGTTAQVKLTGVIRSSVSGETLPGVTVYFPDLRAGTITKADGSFMIAGLPPVSALIQVKLIGYKTRLLTVDLSKETELQVSLDESVIETNEVVVTGISKATEINSNPVPMTFIDSKQLEHNASSNAIDILTRVPGMNVLSTGPNVAKPVIRGLGYNRIITLFDGMRQEGQQWGDEHGIEIDQYVIDRVEVVKGPASLIYGSDALGGVINLLPAFPVSQNSLTAAATLNYQTNNGLRAASVACDGNKNGIGWGLRGTIKSAHDYRNRADGAVYNTGFAEKDLYSNLGIVRSWGYSHLAFSIYDNQQEIPDGSRDSASRKFTKQITEEDTARPVVSGEELRSYSISTIHQRVQHYRLNSNSSFMIGNNRLSVRAGYQQNIRNEYGHPSEPGLPGLSLRLHTITYDLKYYFAEFRRWQTTIGANGMRQMNVTGNGTDFIIPEFQLLDIGPFVYAEKKHGRWNFAFGARYDTRIFNNESLFLVTDPATGYDKKTTDTSGARQLFRAYSKVYSGSSGSFGATCRINDHLILKANIARGYRAPNITEISAYGVHPGTGFMQIGNDNFKPEFSLQEDVGLFFTSEHVSANAELFHNRIDNYIFNRKLFSLSGGDSIYQEGGNDFPVFKFAQTRAQLIGGEMEIDIHPHPLDWLHIENSVSMVYAQNLGGQGVAINSSNKYLPFIPPLHTNSEVRAEFRKGLGRLTGLFVKVGFQYYAAQNRVYSENDTETSTPGYGLIDAGFGGHVTARSGKTLFTFGIFGTNLTDQVYQSNLSRLKYMEPYPSNLSGRSGIYNMGTNISVRLTIPVSASLN